MKVAISAGKGVRAGVGVRTGVGVRSRAKNSPIGRSVLKQAETKVIKKLGVSRVRRWEGEGVKQ